jgi:uncharacterized Zn finger protein (UPF0148 family)
MMADVACFCGCLYSFDGGAGACPRCGEYATVSTEPALTRTKRGQLREQRVPAIHQDGQNGQSAESLGSYGRALVSDLLNSVSVASTLARDPRAGQTRRR